MIKFEVAM